MAHLGKKTTGTKGASFPNSLDRVFGELRVQGPASGSLWRIMEKATFRKQSVDIEGN
jgi:hypothetical protein